VLLPALPVLMALPDLPVLLALNIPAARILNSAVVASAGRD
jgi:hypothetical protein